MWNHNEKAASASQGERPQEKPNMLTPGSWTSGLQNCEEINVCCLSRMVCGILLWQPQQTNTVGRPNRNIYIFYKSYRFCPICWISFTLFLQLNYSQKVVPFLEWNSTFSKCPRYARPMCQLFSSIFLPSIQRPTDFSVNGQIANTLRLADCHAVCGIFFFVFCFCFSTTL